MGEGKKWETSEIAELENLFFDFRNTLSDECDASLIELNESVTSFSLFSSFSASDFFTVWDPMRADEEREGSGEGEGEGEGEERQGEG